MNFFSSNKIIEYIFMHVYHIYISGYDATVAFRGVGHSKAAFRTLNKYCIGILPEHERLELLEH